MSLCYWYIGVYKVVSLVDQVDQGLMLTYILVEQKKEHSWTKNEKRWGQKRGLKTWQGLKKQGMNEKVKVEQKERQGEDEANKNRFMWIEKVEKKGKSKDFMRGLLHGR